MSKSKQVFVCNSCGGVQSRWMGKCPHCNAWDSLEAETVGKSGPRDPQRGLTEPWQGGGGGDVEATVAAAVALAIAEVGAGQAGPARIPTGIAELDRVLGGGLVPGSAVLVGGDPGIGKSTLMLQAAGVMSCPVL